MPQYNTRLRTNSLILPPRRLRHSPSPPPPSRHQRQPKHAAPIVASPPPFPPPNVVLHPDDAANKTFIAIGRALLAVDNRAITIKDLSQLSLDCGLLCQNLSAASQAITTFIRNHLSRCHQQRTKPLLLSLVLSGTPDDDRLIPALHSRSGGTSQHKEQDRELTSFRRGTTVWYLSELAGAPCPFKRAGLCLDEIDLCAPAHAPKRKRDSPQPRRLPPPRPTIATRTRTHTADAAHSRLRLRLTLRVPGGTSETDSERDSDSDDLSSLPDSDSPDSNPVHTRASRPLSPAAPCPPALPPYPILSPSIPSPTALTPATNLASPSAPSASFPFLPSALSNPPRDFRARSASLPFSSASPPPDSEDEDNDFHNSMVGLRRGSVPLKKENDNDDDYNDNDDSPDAHWSTTPLELLPGLEPSLVKLEPATAVLPPSPHHHHWETFDPHVKPEHASDDERTVLDPDDADPWANLKGAGTRDDPVRIHDVEVLGPESVRSREWDAAWEMHMEVDVESPSATEGELPLDIEREMRASPADTVDTVPTSASSPPSSSGAYTPLDCDDTPLVIHPLRPCDPPVVATVIEGAASPAPIPAAVPLHILTPAGETGIPVYHTLLAPQLPLLRRIDTPLVTLAPLLAFLGLPHPHSHAHAWAPLDAAQALSASCTLPPGVRDVFLQPDLSAWFPAVEVRGGIRAEDVVVEEPATPPQALGSADVTVGAPAFEAHAPAEVIIRVPPPPPPLPLPMGEEQDQEEALFRSFVDFADPPQKNEAPPPQPSPSPSLRSAVLSPPPSPRCVALSPPLSPRCVAPPPLPPPKSAAADAMAAPPKCTVGDMPPIRAVQAATHAEKENAGAGARRQRERGEVPVRRSKRLCGGAGVGVGGVVGAGVTTTRSRTRGRGGGVV